MDLFSEYEHKMYKGTGAQRGVIKQLLNCLYGTFGRKLELLETVNISATDLPAYINTNLIKAVIPIGRDTFTLLMLRSPYLSLIR